MEWIEVTTAEVSYSLHDESRVTGRLVVDCWFLVALHSLELLVQLTFVDWDVTDGVRWDADTASFGSQVTFHCSVEHLDLEPDPVLQIDVIVSATVSRSTCDSYSLIHTPGSRWRSFAVSCLLQDGDASRPASGTTWRTGSEDAKTTRDLGRRARKRVGLSVLAKAMGC
jgi:hypothetical protein